MTKYLTPEGLEKLKKELEHLEKIGRKEMAEKLKQAISFGDLSENAAYDEAKEAQGFLEGRISELKGIISSAQIIEKNNTTEVQIGSTVLICTEGKNQEFQVVGSEEADVLNGRISNQSPLGKTLLGKRKGEKIKIRTPECVAEYEIIEIK
ncbi:MAG: transcription elongation factor GreA, partial [Patescibacteria group bacterium]